MAGHMMYCSECKIEKKEPFYGYYPFMSEDAICQEHNCKMEKVPISCDEYCIISRISRDVNFLEAMIKLKETDIIEYESRMAQFRYQVEQQEQAKQTAEENSKPHCPHCNSTNIKSISGLNRGASIAMWGIFSKKINKSFECKNCGYTW